MSTRRAREAASSNPCDDAGGSFVFLVNGEAGRAACWTTQNRIGAAYGQRACATGWQRTATSISEPEGESY